MFNYNNLFQKLRVASLLFVAFLLLTSCSGFFDKDNTPTPKPLTYFKPEMLPRMIWSVKTSSGFGTEYQKDALTLTEAALYTTSPDGLVSSVNKFNGQLIWQVNTNVPISTGVGLGHGLVVIVSRKGDVIALNHRNGQQIWRKNIQGEILAKPSVAKNIVLIKTVDGYVRALSTHDGHEVWTFQQIEPSLILRGSSAPLIAHRDVVVGFANGNLSKLTLDKGELLWIHTIGISEGSFAVQRMIDIDANPIIYHHSLYVATYQGKIASLDWYSGKQLWAHTISSFTGMTADMNAVYVSDAMSNIWSFNADGGFVNWRQDQLEARVITAPAMMGDYIVVGDAEGYLHWLNKNDGHLAAREKVGPALYATPMVENNVLYAFAGNGYLMAYTF